MISGIHLATALSVMLHMEQEGSGMETKELIERLKEDDEMLRDGMQDNLTKAWHNEAMKNAAEDCAEAADRLSEQQQVIDELVAALEPFAKLGQEAAWLTKSDDAQAWGFDGTNLYWGNFRLALEAYSRAKGINKDRK